MKSAVRLLLLVSGWLLAMPPAPALAQDVLSRAKTYYASASYEEALATLTSLRGKTSAPETTEVSLYEVFCLVALGRNDEARLAIETIVRADPEYRLTDAQASPRVRTMFDTIRRPMLAGVIREAYTRGRDAFERKDLPVALKEFDRVIALAAEIEPINEPGLRDLRTLATGFRDLGRMAVAPAAPEPAPAKPAEPAAPAPPPSAPAPPPAPPKVEGPVTFSANDAEVKPPVVIAQSFPPWIPATSVEAKRDFRGFLDLLIDENGRVVSAAVVRPIHDRYDPQLLEAARRWTYKPATKDGKPVRYRHTVAVNLGHK